MPLVVHSLEQSIGERTFFNNTGLFVELEGSMDIRWKEGRSLVEEFIVGAVLECKTHGRYCMRRVDTKFFGV